MNCAEGSSREQWTQFAFRGGSTKRNSWDVIDFWIDEHKNEKKEEEK